MSNIVSDNSNTIFSAILGDLRNLRVIFNYANNSEKTMEDYTKDDNLDIASTARELQKSLDDIEKGKHIQVTTPKVSKNQPTTSNIKAAKSRVKKLTDEQIQKVEKSINKKITSNEHDLEDR